MLRLSTAGESHGKGLFAVLEGVPAGLKVNLEEIDRYLSLRQSGYGRGARQKIECDKVEILSGVRGGVTLGSPVTLAVFNRDYENWKPYLSPEAACDLEARRLTKVRPGHADYAGMKKFETDDARNILERASARETAARVAAGALCRGLLNELNIEITGYVKSVCGVLDGGDYTFEQIKTGRLRDLFMMDAKKQEEAKALINQLQREGDTAGGVIELRVKGVKSGFGSPMTYHEKLDAKLIGALLSVQAIKGAEVGLGFAAAHMRGSEVHDEMYLENGAIVRKTNRAGGIEGGMTNGEEIVLRAAMKPIPTLMRGLNTVDTAKMEPARAAAERSDTCAVLACEVILESVVAFTLAAEILNRLGGDTVRQIKERYGRLPQ